MVLTSFLVQRIKSAPNKLKIESAPFIHPKVIASNGSPFWMSILSFSRSK